MAVFVWWEEKGSDADERDFNRAANNNNNNSGGPSNNNGRTERDGTERTARNEKMFVIIQWVLKIKYTHTLTLHVALITHSLTCRREKKSTERETNILPYHVHSHQYTVESRSWAQEMALWAKYTKAELRWQYIDICTYDWVILHYTLFLLSLPAALSASLPGLLTQVCMCVCVSEWESGGATESALHQKDNK